MFQFSKGDKVCLIALSNGLQRKQKPQIDSLINTLKELHLDIEIMSPLYRQDCVFHAEDQHRASLLMKAYEDKTIKAIFDVSGGDLANGILPFLDYEVIQLNKKPFFGYSDLTTVVNAIYAKTNCKTYLYQIRNLVREQDVIQLKQFKQTFFEADPTLLQWDYDFIQGKSLSGIVVGGNIRCLLKLAGTPYMPNFKNKILFLEAMSGDVAKMATYLNHLKQLNVFDQINGLILGSFTELENSHEQPTIIELVKRIIQNEQLPIIKTSNIGHGADSKCLMIGEEMNFKISEGALKCK